MATDRLQKAGPCSACENEEPNQDAHTFPRGCLESIDSALSTYGTSLKPHPAHVVDIYSKAMKKLSLGVSPLAMFATNLTLDLYNTENMAADLDNRIDMFDNLFASVY